MAKRFTLDFPGRRCIDLGELAVASTIKFQATIRKNGVAWDLSHPSSTVVLGFEGPTGTESSCEQFTRDMTAVDAAGGVFEYTTTTDEITQAGYWTLTVTVSVQNVSATYEYEIAFEAMQQP
jgi:hypothetical protein